MARFGRLFGTPDASERLVCLAGSGFLGEFERPRETTGSAALPPYKPGVWVIERRVNVGFATRGSLT